MKLVRLYNLNFILFAYRIKFDKLKVNIENSKCHKEEYNNKVVELLTWNLANFCIEFNGLVSKVKIARFVFHLSSIKIF